MQMTTCNVFLYMYAASTTPPRRRPPPKSSHFNNTSLNFFLPRRAPREARALEGLASLPFSPPNYAVPRPRPRRDLVEGAQHSPPPCVPRGGRAPWCSGLWRRPKAVSGLLPRPVPPISIRPTMPRESWARRGADSSLPLPNSSRLTGCDGVSRIAFAAAAPDPMPDFSFTFPAAGFQPH